MDEIYRKKLSLRMECTKFTDPPFHYDKEEFTTFLKSFYKEVAKNEELGLVKMARSFIDEILKTPNLVLALIYFSRQDDQPGSFINWYTAADFKNIKLTDVSIAKNAIQFLDEKKATEALQKL